LIIASGWQLRGKGNCLGIGEIIFFDEPTIVIVRRGIFLRLTLGE